MAMVIEYIGDVLKDDGTNRGGVAFVGETVADFIESAGISTLAPLSVLNKALIECGIKPFVDVDEWLDKNEWLMPDDGGYDCIECDYWMDGEGCVRHMKGKNCWMG